VRETFHAAIHRYIVKKEEHWANSTDLRIPAALAPAVAGVSKLNDFGAHPAYHNAGRARRSKETGKWQPMNPVADATVSFSGNGYYLVAPYDFATIYNLLPLWNAGVTGQNQTAEGVILAGAAPPHDPEYHLSADLDDGSLGGIGLCSVLGDAARHACRARCCFGGAPGFLGYHAAFGLHHPGMPDNGAAG